MNRSDDMGDDELRMLRDASAGLEYPSERDHPFDAFRWPATDAKTTADEVARRFKGSTIERVELAAFFDPLAGADDAERFEKLQTMLERLQDVAAFRVASKDAPASVAIYLVGRSRSGGWVGVHTVSIET